MTGEQEKELFEQRVSLSVLVMSLICLMFKCSLEGFFFIQQRKFAEIVSETRFLTTYFYIDRSKTLQSRPKSVGECYIFWGGGVLGGWIDIRFNLPSSSFNLALYKGHLICNIKRKYIDYFITTFQKGYLIFKAGHHNKKGCWVSQNLSIKESMCKNVKKLKVEK